MRKLCLSYARSTILTRYRKMENFIRTKYDSKRWVMDGPMPDPATLETSTDDEVVSFYLALVLTTNSSAADLLVASEYCQRKGAAGEIGIIKDRICTGSSGSSSSTTQPGRGPLRRFNAGCSSSASPIYTCCSSGASCSGKDWRFTPRFRLFWQPYTTRRFRETSKRGCINTHFNSTVQA